MVFTTLENLEISGNWLILENSGKSQGFKIYAGNLSDAVFVVCIVVSKVP